MPLIAKLTERLKRHPKRVVFPEGSDPRILQAARKFAARGLGIPILLGERRTIKSNAEQLDISLEHIRIIEPRRSSACLAAKLCARLKEAASFAISAFLSANGMSLASHETIGYIMQILQTYRYLFFPFLSF